MYDHIVGDVVAAHGTSLVLRAGGVGYELKVPVGTASACVTGESACVFTILHVVDGTPSLLGFRDASERELARRLLAVSGVGPSIALAILSTYDPASVARIIVEGDLAALKRVKGVGAKTAERLCLELRDRVDQLEFASSARRTAAPVTIEPAAGDAIAALVTLGYAERDAHKRVTDAAAAKTDSDTESLIKAVLRGR
jgi:Holliday junction DNA helicase RuvA